MDFTQIVGHEDIIKHFKLSIEMGRVSHAYILNGEEESGKQSLAVAFAKTLQCEAGGTEPCNQCQSCRQTDNFNQPDIKYITHEKANLISVDEIREQLVQDIDEKPYSSRYKIYIIPDGEMMNPAAQNALLKTIEEPPAYGVILILTSNVEKLLPTIVSRCITLNIKPVKEKDILEYLLNNCDITEDKASFCVEYAQGNLGKAVKLATNEEYQQLVQSVIRLQTNIFDMDMDSVAEAITACERFKVSIGEYLDLMMVWYRDILMLKVTGKLDKIMFRDQMSTIREQAKYLSFNEIEDKFRAIERAKQRLNANAKLEDIMRLLILTLKEK